MVPFPNNSLAALEIAAWDDEESTACVSFLDGSKRPPPEVPAKPKPLSSLTESDFERGDALGSGSFATVYEIEAVRGGALLLLQQQDNDDFTPEHHQQQDDDAVVVYPPLFAAGRWDSHSIDSLIDTIATCSTTTDGEDLSSATTPDSSVAHLSSWGSSSSSSQQPQQETLKRCRRRRQRYVVKCLNERARSDPNYTHVGLLGLQREAEILGDLPSQHPNVISLVGVGGGLLLKGFRSSTDVDEEQQASQSFLVLGRLEETLEDRLQRLRKGSGSSSSTAHSLKKPVTLLQNLFSSNTSSSNSKNQEEEQQQAYDEQQARGIHVGLGLARALQFLHSHGVLYRDLKPSNVGFDAGDNVRLFDFGLSRRMVVVAQGQQQEKNGGGGGENNCARQLTSCVGSLRFMSPEMYHGGPYSFPTDVHSFGILLWEVLTLERPFAHARSRHQFVDAVYTRQQRPSLLNNSIAGCSPAIRDLLAATWDPVPKRRPTFAAIVECLQAESQKLL